MSLQYQLLQPATPEQEPRFRTAAELTRKSVIPCAIDKLEFALRDLVQETEAAKVLRPDFESPSTPIQTALENQDPVVQVQTSIEDNVIDLTDAQREVARALEAA